MRVNINQQDQKLFTAKTNDQVCVPDTVEKDFSQLTQYKISRIVTMNIINILELVKITHHYADIAVSPLCSGYKTIQGGFQVMAVIETGQGIYHGHDLQTFGQSPDMENRQSLCYVMTGFHQGLTYQVMTIIHNIIRKQELDNAYHLVTDLHRDTDMV